MPICRRFRSLGYTLTEIIVVCVVITVVVSLTLVGLSAARESSRRIACQNNIHQIGIAIANFVGRKNHYPPLFGPLLPNRAKNPPRTYTNPFVAIFADLEVQYKLRPNGEVVVHEEEGADPVTNFPPAIFRCPSADDYLAYRFNLGASQFTEDADGMLRIFKGISPSEVRDGLSNTCILSERIAGIGKTSLAGIATAHAATRLDFSSACFDAARRGHFVPETGKHWWSYHTQDISYDHTRSPNSRITDCYGVANDSSGIVFLQSIFARSNHSGGVFTLKGDSSVSWIGSNIDAEIWKAMATPSGGEQVVN